MANPKDNQCPECRAPMQLVRNSPLEDLKKRYLEYLRFKEQIRNDVRQGYTHNAHFLDYHTTWEEVVDQGRWQRKPGNLYSDNDTRLFVGDKLDEHLRFVMCPTLPKSCLVKQS